MIFLLIVLLWFEMTYPVFPVVLVLFQFHFVCFHVALLNECCIKIFCQTVNFTSDKNYPFLQSYFAIKVFFDKTNQTISHD